MYKTKYVKPCIAVESIYSENLLISFSGETIPEEADAKGVWIDNETVVPEYRTLNFAN